MLTNRRGLRRDQEDIKAISVFYTLNGSSVLYAGSIHSVNMKWSLQFTSFLLLEAMAWLLHPAFGNEESSSSMNDALSADHAEQYMTPTVDPSRMHFAEHFDDLFGNIEKRWIKSKASKEDAAEDVAKYDGEWKIEQPIRVILSGDFGLVLKSKAKHAAIASHLLLNRPFVFKDKPLVLQYEVTLQEGQECGGSYIKLLSDGDNTNLKLFNDKTPYTIMFGPDKCGNDVKLHFIFRHVNPINGSIEEKHCNKQKERLDDLFKDRRPHLYQLIIRPDNTYTIRIDHKTINEGGLLTNFTPPVNPPAEIDDPNDHKPENWDDREMIPDPESKKPQDWDENEPAQIPDPKATKPHDWLDDLEEMVPDDTAIKPDDWDNDMDGEWEPPLIPNPLCEKAVGCGLWKAPMISNPNYKGKWRPPLIANINYQGKWAPRKISNPDYFEDLNPFRMTAIVAVGIEIWSMSNEILFDNIVLTDDESVANEWASQTFDLKLKTLDRQAQTLWDRALRYMNYKPAYWGAYFVYCSIPMIAYVWFLWTRRDNKSDAKTVSGLMKKTDDYTATYDKNASTELDEERSNKNDLNVTKNPHHDSNVQEEGDGSDDALELQDKINGEDERELEKWNDEVNDGMMNLDDIKNCEAEEGLKKRKARKD